MAKKRWMVPLVLMAVMTVAQAQEKAVKQVADGHYYGARQALEQVPAGQKGHEEAEALVWVCDYVLGERGRADGMGEWVEAHPLSPYADVLRVLRRNLLIKEGRTDEALTLFFADEDLSVETPLAYPLTGLSEEMHSYNEALYRLAGEQLYDERQYGRALPYLEAGEKTRTAQYKQGMCHYHMGQYAQAYEALVASASGAQDEMAQNAWLHAGIAALQQGQKENARQAFRQASELSASPTLREQALYDYALTLHEQSAPQTVAVMEQFLNEYPASQHAAPVSQCLAEVYMTKKDYAKALSAINKVQTPNADTQTDKQKVLYQLAFKELNANHVQQALTYAGQAIALGRQDVEAYAEAYYIKGDCNYRMGNYPQAANDLNTALNLGAQTPGRQLRNQAYAVYSLGYAQFKQQKYNAAIAQFQKVTELADADVAMRADAHNRMGDCYLNMRDYDQATAHYGLAKETSHAQGDYAMLQQAYIEGLKGNYDKKVEVIDQMNAEYATSSLAAQALFEQGRAYVLSGKTDEAAAVFGAVAMRYPQSDYARKASEELQTMAANIVMQDSIAAAQDSLATEAAKAPVVAAQVLYEAGQYQQAEQQLNAAIDAGIAKPYWLARAFVLLSDIYKAEGREVEARQTLESLKANYREEDDIQLMIRQRMQ